MNQSLKSKVGILQKNEHKTYIFGNNLIIKLLFFFSFKLMFLPVLQLFFKNPETYV